jgi:hypothetical protein
MSFSIGPAVAGVAAASMNESAAPHRMAANRLINMLNSSCGHDETAARAGQAEPAAWRRELP